jgi:diguanylate cyclase (GGDEF)-like protein
MITTARPLRVLVADDDAQILDAYRRVLDGLRTSATPAASDLDALSAELFGDAPAVTQDGLLSDVVYLRQGEQAVRTVAEARESGLPFAIVFLDMRMPPGIDGLETARRIRALDPNINIVIVTGYSDHKPAEITAAVGRPEKLFYLLKPFDGGELQQLTTALANRWAADINMTEELARRVTELEDMNERLKASEAQAQQAARLDALTGLLNRHGLKERCREEAEKPHAAGSHVSVFFLDLDRFKDVNDSLGHAAGDDLIREFARRVNRVTGEDGFAARLGGDEFAVICAKPGLVAVLGQRLLDACSAPYFLNGHTVQSGVSIGVAHAESSETSLTELMRQADIALYTAKASGRGMVCAFDPSMERDILGTQRLANDLAGAIARDELVMHYQPLVCAEGRPISSVEALLRWEHPVQGWISPLMIIKVAEKSDLIHTLGDWIARRAFQDSRKWPDLITSINISPLQLRSRDFVERLAALVTELEVAPDRIELEITETGLISDLRDASEKSRRLKALGFRIVLDDFGSGFAGISYLNQIPFDKLKIDRSLIESLSVKSNPGEAVQSIVGLARSYGLFITAGGVEDREQQVFLKSAGCTHLQGFFFHHPMAAEDLCQLLTTTPKLLARA